MKPQDLEAMLTQARESAYERGRLDAIYANDNHVILQLTLDQFELVRAAVAAVGTYCEMQDTSKLQQLDALRNELFRAATDYNKAVSA